MKKISIIIALLSLSIVGYGQSTTFPGYPLYGTAANADRTYRSLQLGTTTIADTLGSTVDTIQLIPGFVLGAGAVFHKDYVLNLKDSCALAITNLGNSYTFSTITIYINAPSITSKIYFSGWSGFNSGTSYWALQASATSIAPTSSHWYILNLVCTGTKWVTQSYVQD